MEKEQNHLNASEKASAAKAHGYDKNADIVAKGAWEKLDSSGLAGILRLSKRSTLDTPFHEAFHAVWDLVLTAKEKAAMLKHYAPIAKAEGRDVQEVMADAYAAWKLKREKLRKGSMFGKLWQKMKDFATRLYAALTGLENANNIMRKIESGEVWKRSAEDAAENGKRYAVTNRRISGNTQVPIVDLTDVVPVSKETFFTNKNITDFANSIKGLYVVLHETSGDTAVIGRFADFYDVKHTVASSLKSQRTDETRLKILNSLSSVLQNAIYVDKNLDSKHGSQNRYIELFVPIRNGDKVERFRIIMKEIDRNSNTYEIGEAGLYDITRIKKDKGLHLSASKTDTQAAIGTNAQSGSVFSNPPSTISVADLLRGVNDRNGNPYVDANGNLNYELGVLPQLSAPQYSVEPAKTPKGRATVEGRIAGAIKSGQPETISESIKRKGAKGWIKAHLKKFYVNWFDKNHMLKDLNEALIMAKGAPLDSNEDVYTRAQIMNANAQGIADALINGGALEVREANAFMKNVKMPYEVSLKMVLDFVDPGAA